VHHLILSFLFFIPFFIPSCEAHQAPPTLSTQSPVHPVNEAEYKDLIHLARQAREKAYSNSSRSPVKVGAVLKTTDGKLFTGANLKLNFGLNLCAELYALYTAIHQLGGDNFRIDTILVESNLPHGCATCGICRQALSAFCTPKTKFIFRDRSNTLVMGTLETLLPLPYKK